MMPSTLSAAIKARAERSGMTPAQALSYRAGALEARVISATSASNVLAALDRKEPRK